MKKIINLYWLTGILFIPAYCSAQNKQLFNYIGGELIIQIKSSSEAIQLTNKFINYELTPKQLLSDILNVWLFTYDTLSVEPAVILNQLNQSEMITTAQFNHYIEYNSINKVKSIETTNTEPNDLGFPLQYGMNKIHAPEAWNITTGGTTIQNDQIVVAVIDDGFDLSHTDLDFWKNNNEIPNNGIDDDNNYYPDDYDGWNAYDNNGIITSADHGTHVSGIIGAKGNNSDGVTGVNWNVKIMPIMASSQTEATVVAGYGYVLKMRQLYNETSGSQGAFIVATNASFSVISPPEDNFLWCNIFDALGEVGILNINAPQNINNEIGNGYGEIKEVPAMCSSQYLIVVSNSDANDELNESASWGKSYVDLVAPGTGIYSTKPGNTYSLESGTSQAAPHVTGAIALMYAAACDQLISSYKTNPGEVALSIKQILLNSSDPVFSLLLKIGNGRLNVHKSLLNLIEQFDYNLNITGTQIESTRYDAIQNIIVQDYSGFGENNVVFRAGNSIDFSPGTILSPGIGGGFHAYTDLGTFACAIPFQPLTVNLISPPNPYCGSGSMPITCNAVPSGGKPPYSFEWYKMNIEIGADWETFNLNNPNFNTLTSFDFNIQVKVIDERGVSALSDIILVDCIDASRIADTLFIQSEAGLPMKESKIQFNDQLFIDSLQQTFNISPNPFEAKMYISFKITDASIINIQLFDCSGRLVSNVVSNKRFSLGNHLIEFDGEGLSPGLYFCTLTSNDFNKALLIIK